MNNNIIIVGAGLFGSVCAYELQKKGYDVTVFEQNSFVGGNCYSEKINNIEIHKYGAHIFHTKSKKIWEYINRFTEFNNYIHKVYINYNNILYPLPFNLLTYQLVFGKKFSIPLSNKEKNIVIDMFIRNYSEKQWNTKLENIPQFVLDRVPFKYSLNNDYFENQYQGIPVNGYTKIFKEMLKNVKVILNKRYDLSDYDGSNIIFTGCIDKFFNYKFGKLKYRSLNFEHIYLKNIDDYQHNSVINYPDKNIKYTRIIEHKHFAFNKCKGTWITKEYPSDIGDPYYPINDKENNELYQKYINYAKEKYPNIIFGGRLGFYKYMDMDKIIESALNIINMF